MPSKAKATAITDHDEIRRWAEDRGAKPACVRKTGSDDDVGIIRLDFPGYSGEESLEPIEWDIWFEKFDSQGLALLHQETTANGEKSNFNKLVKRETANAVQESNGKRSSSGKSPAKAKTTIAKVSAAKSPTVSKAESKKAATHPAKSHSAPRKAA